MPVDCISSAGKFGDQRSKFGDYSNTVGQIGDQGQGSTSADCMCFAGQVGGHGSKSGDHVNCVGQEGD